jgi:hypothetical protein
MLRLEVCCDGGQSTQQFDSFFSFFWLFFFAPWLFTVEHGCMVPSGIEAASVAADI